MSARPPGLLSRCAAKARNAAGTAGAAIGTAARKAVQPHKAALAHLAEMPLTVLGTAGIDFAAFHYVHMIGWLVTGVSLILVEHLIADEA